MNTMKFKTGWFAVGMALVVGFTAVVMAAHRERDLAWDDGHAWGHDLRSGRRTAHEFAHYINWNIYHARHEVQDHFERGFRAGYGRDAYGVEHGSKVYETAWQAARAAEEAIDAALGGSGAAPKSTETPRGAPSQQEGLK
jgi:hypothetical protein